MTISRPDNHPARHIATPSWTSYLPSVGSVKKVGALAVAALAVAVVAPCAQRVYDGYALQTYCQGPLSAPTALVNLYDPGFEKKCLVSIQDTLSDSYNFDGIQGFFTETLELGAPELTRSVLANPDLLNTEDFFNTVISQITQGNTETVELLLVNQNRRLSSSHANILLNEAIRKDDLKTVELVLTHTSLSNWEIEDTLETAISKNNPELFKALLGSSEELSLRAVNNLLNKVSEKKDPTLLKLLLAHSNPSNLNIIPSLEAAVSRNDFEIVKALLGANRVLSSEELSSLVALANQVGSLEILAILISDKNILRSEIQALYESANSVALKTLLENHPLFIPEVEPEVVEPKGIADRIFTAIFGEGAPPKPHNLDEEKTLLSLSQFTENLNQEAFDELLLDLNNIQRDVEQANETGKKLDAIKQSLHSKLLQGAQRALSVDLDKLSSRELKNLSRKLARRVHPDKCKFKVCKREYLLLEAYKELLTQELEKRTQ